MKRLVAALAFVGLALCVTFGVGDTQVKATAVGGGMFAFIDAIDDTLNGASDTTSSNLLVIDKFKRIAVAFSVIGMRNNDALSGYADTTVGTGQLELAIKPVFIYQADDDTTAMNSVRWPLMPVIRPDGTGTEQLSNRVGDWEGSATTSVAASGEYHIKLFSGTAATFSGEGNSGLYFINPGDNPRFQIMELKVRNLAASNPDTMRVKVSVFGWKD